MCSRGNELRCDQSHRSPETTGLELSVLPDGHPEPPDGLTSGRGDRDTEASDA
jgi:hypothetical protein